MTEEECRRGLFAQFRERYGHLAQDVIDQIDHVVDHAARSRAELDAALAVLEHAHQLARANAEARRG